MQKPILRWTIGQVSTEGMECLKISVDNIVKLYKNNFQLFICYNNIEKNELNWTKKYYPEAIRTLDLRDWNPMLYH